MGNCSSENSNQVDTRVHTKPVEPASVPSEQKNAAEQIVVPNAQSSRVASRAQSSSALINVLDNDSESKGSDLYLEENDNLEEKLELTKELDQ